MRLLTPRIHVKRLRLIQFVLLLCFLMLLEEGSINNNRDDVLEQLASLIRKEE